MRRRVNRFFPDQGVECGTETDAETMERLHRVTDSVHHLCYDSVKDNLDMHHEDVCELLESIIYQNFMLMRRVDSLSAKVDALERKLNS